MGLKVKLKVKYSSDQIFGCDIRRLIDTKIVINLRVSYKRICRVAMFWEAAQDAKRIILAMNRADFKFISN